MHGSKVSKNGARFHAARGRPTIPSTNPNTLLRQVFDEQDRLHISVATLSKISGVTSALINDLRHPGLYGGKRINIDTVRRLAEAMDFRWPERLEKRS